MSTFDVVQIIKALQPSAELYSGHEYGSNCGEIVMVRQLDDAFEEASGDLFPNIHVANAWKKMRLPFTWSQAIAIYIANDQVSLEYITAWQVRAAWMAILATNGACLQKAICRAQEAA